MRKLNRAAGSLLPHNAGKLKGIDAFDRPVRFRGQFGSLPYLPGAG